MDNIWKLWVLIHRIWCVIKVHFCSTVCCWIPIQCMRKFWTLLLLGNSTLCWDCEYYIALNITWHSWTMTILSMSCACMCVCVCVCVCVCMWEWESKRGDLFSSDATWQRCPQCWAAWPRLIGPTLFFIRRPLSLLLSISSTLFKSNVSVSCDCFTLCHYGFFGKPKIHWVASDYRFIDCSFQYRT